MPAYQKFNCVKLEYPIHYVYYCHREHDVTMESKNKTSNMATGNIFGLDYKRVSFSVPPHPHTFLHLPS